MEKIKKFFKIIGVGLVIIGLTFSHIPLPQEKMLKQCIEQNQKMINYPEYENCSKILQQLGGFESFFEPATSGAQIFLTNLSGSAHVA